jgi:hypothetical protein
MIIFMALTSQLSAGIADMNGAGRLISEASHRRLPDRLGYFATACVAIAITWNANIFEIIVFASKAFALYYGFQAIIALWAARVVPGENAVFRQLLFVLAAALALAVLVFGSAV